MISSSLALISLSILSTCWLTISWSWVSFFLPTSSSTRSLPLLITSSNLCLILHSDSFLLLVCLACFAGSLWRSSVNGGTLMRIKSPSLTGEPILASNTTFSIDPVCWFSRGWIASSYCPQGPSIAADRHGATIIITLISTTEAVFAFPGSLLWQFVMKMIYSFMHLVRRRCHLFSSSTDMGLIVAGLAVPF